MASTVQQHRRGIAYIQGRGQHKRQHVSISRTHSHLYAFHRRIDREMVYGPDEEEDAGGDWHDRRAAIQAYQTEPMSDEVPF